ncbi:MAG: hypothetical protein ACFFDF_18535 [Candidatus Odinarchaeota archaeon]
MNEEKRIIKSYRAEDEDEIREYLKNNVIEENLNNPYLRHLNILFKYGKPPGDYHIIQLKSFNKIYLLGVIIFSLGGRLLFFPSFKDMQIFNQKSKKYCAIDHITCEKSLKKTHLKFKDRSIRFNSIPIKKVGNYNFWFGFSIDKPKILYSTSKKRYLIRSTKENKNHFKERIDLSNISYKEGFGFDIQEEKIDNSKFLNFEIFIKKGSNHELKDLISIPINSYNANFTSSHNIRTMIRQIYNKKFNFNFIIRMAILEKNKDNKLSKV